MLDKNIASIFKDAELQEAFDKNGFVKISFLSPEKVQQLYSNFTAHQKAHEAIESRYLATTHTNDPDLIRNINQEIKAVVVNELDRYFMDVEPMMCTYITKQPGEGSETKFHQDPTFVDETKYVSANIWIALHDINHENGNLFFVKGTHRFMPSLRVTPDCPTAYDNVKDLLHEHLTEVPVKAGDAIIINHSVMHGATPNFSEGLRIAAVMAIRSKGSEWIYHYLERGAPFDKIEKYKVNLDTFVSLEKDGRPTKAQFDEYVTWDFPKMSREAFISAMDNMHNKGPFARYKRQLQLLKQRFFAKG